MSYYIWRSVSINLSPSFALYTHIVSVDIWQGGFYSKHTQMIMVYLWTVPLLFCGARLHINTHTESVWRGKHPVHFYELTQCAKNTEQAFILQIKDITVSCLFSWPDFMTIIWLQKSGTDVYNTFTVLSCYNKSPSLYEQVCIPSNTASFRMYNNQIIQGWNNTRMGKWLQHVLFGMNFPFKGS